MQQQVGEHQDGRSRATGTHRRRCEEVHALGGAPPACTPRRPETAPPESGGLAAGGRSLRLLRAVLVPRRDDHLRVPARVGSTKRPAPGRSRRRTPRGRARALRRAGRSPSRTAASRTPPGRARVDQHLGRGDRAGPERRLQHVQPANGLRSWGIPAVAPGVSWSQATGIGAGEQDRADRGHVAPFPPHDRPRQARPEAVLDVVGRHRAARTGRRSRRSRGTPPTGTRRVPRRPYSDSSAGWSVAAAEDGDDAGAGSRRRRSRE